jgi:predicted nucleotidyltransferase
MMTLDDLKHDELLADVVAVLSSEHTESIVLAGSTVRGDATPYSDLDVAHIVNDGYIGPEKNFHYRAGRLVSVSARTFEWWRRVIGQPERAVFLLPGIREARVLFDPHGAFGRFHAELDEFSWAPLQPAANTFAGATLAAQAETVHKILSALVRDEGMFEPAAMLTLDMTYLMAVQRGVLVESSASYIRQVRAAMGDGSAWSTYHRIATNQLGEASPAPSLRQQAIATLHLYRETFRLIESVMPPDRRDLAARTVQVVDEAFRLFES